MWAWPNINGEFTAGMCLKLKGPNSFEYFKSKGNIEESRKYFYQYLPDTKNLIHINDDYFENIRPIRMLNFKCSPWNIGKFLLIGDAAHT